MVTSWMRMKRAAAVALGLLSVPLSGLAEVHLYPQPPGEAREAAGYRVVVDGKPAGVAAVRHSAMPVNIRWPGHQRELDQTEIGGMVRFSTDRPVAVSVTAPRDFTTVRIRPQAKGIKASVEGRTARFELPGAGFYSVEFDSPHGNLHIFADPPETLRVDPKDPKVRYYGPGEHHADVIRLSSGETLYLDEGAVVYGRIEARDADNIRILGRGILDMSRIKEIPIPIDPALAAAQKAKGFAITNVRRENAIKLEFCDQVLIDGITIRDSLLYTIRPIGCRDLTIRQVKICGNWRYNADGIDMHNCENVRISDCFVRTFDDSICVKGFDYTMRDEEMLHDGVWHDCFTNALIERCTIWCDWGRCLEIGAETRARTIHSIVWRDCDILHVHSTPLDIQNCDQADVHHITFDSIRVEMDQPFPRTTYSPSAKDFNPNLTEAPPPLFASVILYVPEYSKANSQRGRTREVLLRDIHLLGPHRPTFWLQGFDAEHTSGAIVCDGIYWNGREVSRLAATNQNVRAYAQPIRFLRAD
ncbi:MAG: glycosyl hydrolase family 28 protein [Kiritimatiellia bacterium]